MFHLFDTNEVKSQSVVLRPHKWCNICLMHNITSKPLYELTDAGAEVLPKSLVYENYTDASIQVAYMASRADIKPDDISLATNNIITAQGYIKLQEIFFEDFPEKFI
jgi:hypothetical protein